MYLLRRLRLFLSIVFREIESKKSGIPDPYRIKGRISPGLAYEIAAIVHPAQEGES